MPLDPLADDQPQMSAGRITHSLHHPVATAAELAAELAWRGVSNSHRARFMQWRRRPNVAENEESHLCRPVHSLLVTARTHRAVVASAELAQFWDGRAR